jgi:putative ABC transport system permease protein
MIVKTLTRGHVKAGIDSVRGAKLRSFWTMLGIIIGVTSVITVVAIGQGIKGQVGNQIQHFDKNLITVRPAQLKTPSDSGSSGLNLLSGLSISAPLSNKDIATVARTKGVSASAPLTIASGGVSGENGPYHDGLVLGTTPDLSSLINQSMAYGTFLSNDDGGNVAVIGQHVADKMFNTDVPLGHNFTFHGEQFVVEGIFNQFVSAPLSQQADFNNAIFIPNQTAENLSKDTAPTYAILARPASAGRTEAVANNIRQALGRLHGGQEDFDVLTGNQNATVSQTILDLLTRLIAGVAAISLLVGGIGIMNVMLVSVAERVHEIGIRKAVGATNRQILSQFMIESSLLSLAGGVIGVLLAYLVEVILRISTSLKPEITWPIVLIASGVSLLVGIIFGTVPALKAALKDPIDALRYE